VRRSVRLLAVAVLAVAVAGLLVSLPVRNAFAIGSLTLNVSPNPVVQGGSLTFSGTETPAFSSASVIIWVYAGSTCTGSPLFSIGTTEDSSGNYQAGQTADPSDYPVGQYCAYSASASGNSDNSGNVLFTVLAPSPAGPVGGFLEPVNKLAVFAPYLAVFGVLAVVVVAVVPWRKRGN
jgi:hypothetical protein